MIELKALEFGGIRRFAEMQRIDFTDKERLIQIDGKNLNTGGSSGAGKTTVFLALDYLLGTCDIPSTVLQSRVTTNPLFVSGEFLVDGRELKIVRGKKTGLVVEFDGETVSGNVKLAEEKLDEIIGIPRNVFKKMIHKKQKEGGFFIGMTGKESYEFLSKILNLDLYTELSESIQKQIREIQQELDSFEIKKESQEKLIAQIEEQVSYLTRPTTSVTQEVLDGLKKHIGFLQGQKIGIDANYSFRLSSLQEPKPNIEGYDDTELNKAQSNLQDCNKKIRKAQKDLMGFEAFDTTIAVAKEKAKNIGAQIKELKLQKAEVEKSICPTCKQSWVTETAKDKISELSAMVDQKVTNALELKKEIDSEPDVLKKKAESEQLLSKLENAQQVLQEKIDNLMKEKSSFESEKNKEYYKKLNEFKEEYKRIEAMHLEEVQPIEKQIQSAELDLGKKSIEFESYKKELKQYEENLSRLSQDLLEEKESLKKLQDSNLAIAEKQQIISESQRLIKTYILQTFQETLDLIGDMATQILAGIPNMANSTIYFEGCKENKDGSIKNEITGIINMDGEDIPIKSLSGGERTAIDLAVDLAVIDVIETKAGKGADFYIIDEPFDGLDAVCRENSLEILSQVDMNKKIIMVDHSTELKEMVSETITIIREGEFSNVV